MQILCIYSYFTYVDIDDIEGKLTEMKGVGRSIQLLDYLRNIRRYWELNEKAKDKKMWKQQFYQSNIKNKYKLSSISLWTF